MARIKIGTKEGKWILMEFQMEKYFPPLESTNNCWKTLSSALSLRSWGAVAAIVVIFSKKMKIFYQLSMKGEISVIKRIYSCFIKIVNSYFSITMIFSLFLLNSQFAFLATNLIHVFLVYLSVRLLCVC